MLNVSIDGILTGHFRNRKFVLEFKGSVKLSGIELETKHFYIFNECEDTQKILMNFKTIKI